MTALSCPKCGAPLPDHPAWATAPCPTCSAIPAKVYASARSTESTPSAASPTPPARKRWPDWLTATVLVGALGAILLVSTFVLPPSPAGSGRYLKPPPSEAERLEDAKWSCRMAIKARLHDPGSAEWGDGAAVRVTDGFEVVWSLRARNGFGALRLGSYVCQVGPSGSNVLSVAALP